MSQSPSPISPVQRFTHPLADLHESYPTASQAETAYQQALAEQAAQDAEAARQQRIKEASHYLRLNTATLSDIPRLWTDLLREHCGVESTLNLSSLSFGEQGCTCDAPIGGRTGGWHGDPIPRALCWNGIARGKWKCHKGTSVFDVMSGGWNANGFTFAGLHPGSGNGGDSFCFAIRFYLDDFPLLKALYERKKGYDAEVNARALLERNHLAKVTAQVQATEDWLVFESSRQVMEADIVRLQEELARAQRGRDRCIASQEALVRAQYDATLPPLASAFTEAEVTAMDEAFNLNRPWN